MTLLILDFDGVIVDSKIPSINTFFKALVRNSYEVKKSSTNKAVVEDLRDVQNKFLRFSPPIVFRD